jgi:hypothetical protein
VDDKTYKRLFVQSLTGSKAQIVLAFFLAGCAMDVKEIQAWTGLKRQTVYDSLIALAGVGIVGKQTLAHGRIVWLPGGDMLPLFQMSEKWTSGATTTTAIGREKLISDSVVVEAGQMSEKRTSGSYEDRKALELRQANEDRQRREMLTEYGIPVEENLAMCRLYGIGEPMASRISEMKHVTPDFIQDHIKSLLPGETKGLAIVRIRCDETPRLWLDEMDQEFGGRQKLTLAEWHIQKEARKAGMTVDQYLEQEDE